MGLAPLATRMTDVDREVTRLARLVNQHTRQIAKLAADLGTVSRRIQRAGLSLTNLPTGATDFLIAWPVPFPDTLYGIWTSVQSGAAAEGQIFAQVKAPALSFKTTDGCTITVVNLTGATVASAGVDILGVRA